MTIAADPGVRYYKTNPQCRGERHRPSHTSFRRGCTCASTLVAEKHYQAELKTTYRGRAGVLPVDGDPRCAGSRHTPTRDSYRLGCRCPGAVGAHEKWRADLKAARTAALERFRATGRCSARGHDSRRAYDELGCRCPQATELHRETIARKPKRDRSDKEHGYRGAVNYRLPVDRINLLLLTAGLRDRPTLGEYLAADVRLSRFRVPDGPFHGRRLETKEIAERLGCTDRTVARARAERIRLRDNRHLRRLQDVHRKAAVVAAAIERGRGR